MDEAADAAHARLADRLTVALTGATGFIGTALQQRLVADGHAVRALVRPDSPRRARIVPGAEPVAAALDDSAALGRALDGIDALVYAAGAVRGVDYADFVPANVAGVAEVCAAMPADAHLVLVSSLAAKRPALSHYARSKRAGEDALAEKAPGRWTVLRPTAVYGPGDREMLPLFRAIRAGLAIAPGPRDQRLSLLHVSDLCAAVSACLHGRGEALAGGRFELHDGREGGYGWADIVADARGRMPVVRLHVPRGALAALAVVNVGLARLLGYAPMLSPGKVRELSEPDWLCDNQPFASATAWHPQVRLAEGVRRLFEP